MRHAPTFVPGRERENNVTETTAIETNQKERKRAIWIIACEVLALSFSVARQMIYR